VSEAIAGERGAGIPRLLKNTRVYFIGNALNRMGAFLLLPLYTRYLTPGQYGSLELVFVSVALVKIMMGMNLSHATLRFHFEYETKSDRDALTSTLLLFVNLWGLLFMLLLIALSRPFSIGMTGSDAYAFLFFLGFILLFFEVASEAPLACLRAQEQSTLFVASSGLHLIFRVALNIYLVVALQKGVEGVLIGNILASATLWGFLSVMTLKNKRLCYDRQKMGALLKYSLPLALAALPGLFIKNADRLFLGWYASLDVLGLYALAMRFQMILDGFVLEPFHLGFGPFRFSIMRQENAARTLATLLTWFALLLCFGGLLIILLSPEVIVLLADRSFHEAYKIIPLLILVTFLRGIHYVFQSGILIAKQTKVIPPITAASAVLNIAALYFLTPRFGAIGAALALVLASLLDTALTYHFSQRVYPVPFELGRIGKILAAAVLVFAAASLIESLIGPLALWSGVVIKLALGIFVFPLLLFLFRFPTQQELKTIGDVTEQIRTKLYLFRRGAVQS